MPTTGIYPVQDIGFPLPIWREGTEEILIGSIEELYNEKSVQAGFQKKTKVLKLEIWLNIVDLHKM
jgi:isoleucyl-tRNA synthetase